MVTQRFTITSETKNLKLIREEIEKLLKKSGLSQKAQGEFLVALGEACTNSMRHSYGGETGKKIRVSYEEKKAKVIIRIRDYGRKIDLAKVKTPKLPAETPGGLGIYFMKTIMDQMEYNTRHLRGNELILVKCKPKEGVPHED